MDSEIKRIQLERRREEGRLAEFGGSGDFDRDLYDDGAPSDAMVTSIPVTDEDEMEELEGETRRLLPTYTAPEAVLRAIPEAEGDAAAHDPFASRRKQRVGDREDEYHARRHRRELSPIDARRDPLAAAVGNRSQGKEGYRQAMARTELEREEASVRRQIDAKLRDERMGRPTEDGDADGDAAAGEQKKRSRASAWDDEDDDDNNNGGTSSAAAAQPSAGKRARGRWDQTPTEAPATAARPRSRWDQTPVDAGAAAAAAGRKRSRWDQTPVAALGGGASLAATPVAMPGMMTPLTPEQMVEARHAHEMDVRNRPLSDQELDDMIGLQGYTILEPPETYQPIRTPARKLLATPSPMVEEFIMAEEAFSAQMEAFGAELEAQGLPSIKPEDRQYFDKLLSETDESVAANADALKERRIMKLLLKVKNGTPPMRKQALRSITDKAREFGPGPLFNQILPLLMSPTLEDQERHLLVKVVDRILFKLDDLVRPYAHKILVVIEPLLIEEDYYARVEGREIISNLAKAAGLATMISTLRPDIDHPDDYVRNTTARAFSVVASALGIPALLPFLRAVCQSRKSWQARHTGVKIVQQIAILMGCAVLPHLKQLVDILSFEKGGLTDEQPKVRSITALALAALAEASFPYGIESFDCVLKDLYYGIRMHRGKQLAAFLKAIGFIIPLMDAEYASFYTKEVMTTLIRNFVSQDEEMKKVVLKVVMQCVATDGVEASYVREEILPEFFRNFWVRRMALDRRNYRALVETTVELANKVGVSDIVERVVDDLKDESEPYRKMVVETIDKIIVNLGAADINPALETRLLDGMLFAFQEQTSDDTTILLSGFGAVVNGLGERVKPYLPQVCGTIKWRLKYKSAAVRQQAADLIARIAKVMQDCDESKLLGHLSMVLFEYLGEEYPDVLAAILGALKAIVNVVGMESMTPPIKEILPRLTPILKNRHERVQENVVDLVGRIADRGGEFVPAKEWMRICFELLEMLKAHRKGIRRAAVNTFGYIAKVIGPADVLVTLLNNLRVQERTNRVCTTVAIAIVAETCAPFTVLPALMNEYRVPELNVQNGVLKAMSFLFEYIGEMGKDYAYAVVPLLEDALIERDVVHRQIGCNVVKHLALGVYGLGCEDACVHLLNLVWPNIFETSPHVINAVLQAIEALRVALGPVRVTQYCAQGLFHPARFVREVYWKIFNSMYIGAQDGLVAAYPRLEDDKHHIYRRTELELVV